MKKRILFILSNLEIGGAEKSLISLLNSFDYSRYDVELFLYQHKGPLMKQLPSKVKILPEIPEYTSYQMSIFEAMRKGHWFVGIIRGLLRLFTKFYGNQATYTQLVNTFTSRFLPKLDTNYDVAISFIWPHHFIINNVKAKKKIGWIHTDYKQIKPINWLDNKVLKKLDYIVSVSDNCKLSFDESHPKLKQKSIMMENIISPTMLKNMAKKNVETSTEAGRVKILTVARFHPDKGVDRAVEACKLLTDAGIDVIWYLIGFGMQEESLKKRIKELGLKNNFIILGKKDNPYPYFNNVDLYVQPSRFEGKSIAITEAKVFNLPIIITDYPSAKDQIKDQYDGLIVENSVEGIYEGIYRLITNPVEAKAYRDRGYNSLLNDSNEIYKLYKIIEEKDIRKSLIG